MRACWAVLLATSALSACRAADADADVLAREKERLQGTWAATAVIDNGREEAAEQVRELKLTIKGDKYIYTLGQRSFAAVYKIDPTKKPKEMDVTFEEGPIKGTTMRAIYALEGDELKICGGDKRPAELASRPKSQVILFVFKRGKP
jgi:uncharacterized protein (TIGR03067 family)